MKVSQLDQIKQGYEHGIYTVELLHQRLMAMNEVNNQLTRRHVDDSSMYVY
jgi:hypothetical protein